MSCRILNVFDNSVVAEQGLGVRTHVRTLLSRLGDLKANFMAHTETQNLHVTSVHAVGV